MATKVCLRVLDALLHHTPPTARPWGEFLKAPSLPISTNYTYRYLTNIVYFARNYLNLVALTLLLWSIAHPLFIVCLALALQLHMGVGGKLARPWLRRLQGVTFAIFVYNYGVGPIFTVITFIFSLVSLHSLVTPYTDEASREFDRLTGQAVETPTTPLVSFQRVKRDPDGGMTLSEFSLGESCAALGSASFTNTTATFFTPPSLAVDSPHRFGNGSLW
eukprot:PhM_4_TR1163/c0_g2_i1/m.65173